MPDPMIREHDARLTAGVLLVVAVLSGCTAMVPQTMALRDAWPAQVPARVELDTVPFHPQLEYQCGPAALATTLNHAGVAVTPADLIQWVYLPARQGSLQVEMQAAPRRYGSVSYPLAPRFDDLLREVAAGNPVLVLQDNGLGPFSVWHYAVVAGFDYAAGELLLRSGVTRRRAVPFTVFEYTWKKSGYWALVTLAPDRIPATATESNYLEAVVAMARVAEPSAVIVAYTTFLERWPENLVASIALANEHYGQGAFEAAEAVLRQAAVHHPDSVVVLNNLAQTVSDQGRSDEALAIIERTDGVESPFATAVGETRAMILRRLATAR